MSYEVQFQHEGAEYVVRGPDIDGVLRLIQGVQSLKYEWCGGELWAPPIGSKQPEWIKWSGGDCPVGSKTEVAVCLRNGNSIGPTQAYSLSWFHNGLDGDIVNYRVCE